MRVAETFITCGRAEEEDILLGGPHQVADGSRE
jgi:hypothetical protein